MAGSTFSFCIVIFVFVYFPAESIILVVPEDVPMGFATIFGFTPKIVKGNDHRFGYGFSFGNHADFQVLYELGPQTITEPLQRPVRVRSATYRQRFIKRRPLLDFLLNLGFVKEVSYRYDVGPDIDSTENDINEPR